MQDPTFSVVVPFLNRSGQFRRLIESVARQSYRPLELIIADNGSSDEEMALVWRECHNFPLLDITLASTIIRRNGNAARNLGLWLARGTHVAFLDSDDFWEENHLERGRDLICNSKELLAVYSGSNINRGGQFVARKSRQIRVDEKVHDFLIGFDHGFAQSSGFIVPTVSRDFATWDESLSRLQDLDYFISLSRFSPWRYSELHTVNIDWTDNRTKRIDFEGVMSFYRKHKTSITHTTKIRFLLFTLKECSIRGASDDAYNYFRRELRSCSALGYFMSLFCIRRVLRFIDFFIYNIFHIALSILRNPSQVPRANKETNL